MRRAHAWGGPVLRQCRLAWVDLGPVGAPAGRPWHRRRKRTPVTPASSGTGPYDMNDAIMQFQRSSSDTRPSMFV